MKNTFIKRPGLNRGFSLVEIMVAVVIALVGTVVMFQVFAVSEGQKRTTTSGSDSQQNGSIALYMLERHLRSAGHGLGALIRLGQPAYGWDVPNDVPRPTRYFRPALITPGAGSDSIEINYTSYSGISAPSYLGADWAPASAAVPNTMALNSTTGFAQGDVLVVCSSTSPAVVANTCILTQTTDVAAGALQLNFPPDNIIRSNTVGPSEYNPTGGFTAKLAAVVAADAAIMPPLYVAGTAEDPLAAVYNIGWNPFSRVYRVQDGRLLENDIGATPQEFADGIVSLRAQYGLDLNGNGSVDVWVNPRGNTGNPASSFTPNHLLFDITSRATIGASWSMVVAVRVGLVTRSGMFEKAEVESRSTIPFWTNSGAGSAVGPEFTVPAGDGKHYRYQIFESIVPFRNTIWTPHR
jgi:type IV pilus assembly protein PilW